MMYLKLVSLIIYFVIYFKSDWLCRKRYVFFCILYILSKAHSKHFVSILSYYFDQQRKNWTISVGRSRVIVSGGLPVGKIAEKAV